MTKENAEIKSMKLHIPVSMRFRLANAGIEPDGQESWCKGVLWGRVRNAERKAPHETEDIHLANMPKDMGNALADLAERRGLESVSELAEELFREALGAIRRTCAAAFLSPISARNES